MSGSGEAQGAAVMYGHRARIGYTSPPRTTEVFPFEFYRIVPDGVTLVLTTLAIVELTGEEVDRSYEISLEAAREMARAGIDLMVLGGVPINLSRGYDNVNALIADTEAAIGVPVSTSITAQMNALAAVGAGTVAVAQPFGDSMNADFDAHLRQFGFTPSGCAALGYPAIDLGRIPLDAVMRAARDLNRAHPDADTLWLPCPHWAVADAIDPLERELGVNVVSALQAITWESLRRCGIDEAIAGFGRLLQDTGATCN